MRSERVGAVREAFRRPEVPLESAILTLGGLLVLVISALVANPAVVESLEPPHSTGRCAGR